MHTFTEETDRLLAAIHADVRARLSRPPPLGRPRTLEELTAAAESTVTAAGLGGDEALRVWREVLYGQIVADLAPDRARIDAPTMILWGDQDTICDAESQERLLKEIVDSRMVVFTGLGHAPHWESPDAVARELEAFAVELVL